jgi:hypothetical protein
MRRDAQGLEASRCCRGGAEDVRYDQLRGSCRIQGACGGTKPDQSVFQRFRRTSHSGDAEHHMLTAFVRAAWRKLGREGAAHN